MRDTFWGVARTTKHGRQKGQAMTKASRSTRRWRLAAAGLATAVAIPLGAMSTASPAQASGPSTACAGVGVNYKQIKDTLVHACSIILCPLNCQGLPIGQIISL